MERDEQQRIFDQWMGRHQGILFKVAGSHAIAAADREDLFQEIALQVWRSVPLFRGDAAESTWIYRVSLNCAMRWRQRERRRDERREAYVASEAVLRQAATQTNPRLAWLYEQIAKMDQVDRSLSLLVLDGFSYREIGEVLGITESHVGVKLNRLKNELSKRSEREKEHDLG
jgi:RNA polymerase sigma-70 factor (ECF subfamily)